MSLEKNHIFSLNLNGLTNYSTKKLLILFIFHFKCKIFRPGSPEGRNQIFLITLIFTSFIDACAEVS